MGMIDFDKFLLSFIEKATEYHPITAFNIPSCIKKALNDQGLQYKDGTFVNTQRNIAAEAKENGYGESKDEMIRKRLMAMCQHYIECYAFDTYNLVGYKEALAWLEAQAEQKFDNIEKLLQAEYKKGWDNALLQLPKEVDSQIWKIANNSAKTWEESFAILCATQKAYNKGKKDASKEYWKPSEEQMTALSEASGIVGMFTPRGTNLQSLYNDLKKLK